MALAKERKKAVVQEYKTHPTDSGSPEVQVALLSERIGKLEEHFKTHKKDAYSKKGLLTMVGQRRKLLSYLDKINPSRYKTLIQKLGLRK